MAQQLINIGSVPNDGTGDTIRVAGNKINQNFTEVYSSLSGIQTYTLPTASTSVLGGVKIDGTTISIDNGVISGNTVTATSDTQHSNNTTAAASTGWVRAAMSNIMSGLGFATGGTSFENGSWDHYIKLPSCLGSYIIQYGSLFAQPGANGTNHALALAYTDSFSVVTTTTNGAIMSNIFIDVTPDLLGTKDNFTIRHNGTSQIAVQWIAIGS
jgi:hypothetical protein